MCCHRRRKKRKKVDSGETPSPSEQQLKNHHHRQQHQSSPTTTIVSGKAIRTGSFVATPPHLRTTIAKPAITIPNDSPLFGIVSRSGGVPGSELMKQIKITVKELTPSKERLASTRERFLKLIDRTRVKSAGELERIKYGDDEREGLHEDELNDNLEKRHRRARSSLGSAESITERSDDGRKKDELQEKQKQPLPSVSKTPTKRTLLRLQQQINLTNLKMMSKQVQEKASAIAKTSKRPTN